MADEEQLSILRQGAETWNTWRREYPGIAVDLRKAHLGEANLSGTYLSWTDLRGADLRRAWLVEAQLRGTRLARANLSEAQLHRADLRGTDLTGAKLGGANLGEAELHGADLSKALLSKADLARADLGGASLRKANLSKADLTGANLSWSKIRGADLTGAKLGETNFSRADLTGANLSWSKIRGADLTGAKLGGTNLTGANLTRANLTEANLYETIFADLDLSGCKGLEDCVHHGPSTIDIRTLQRSAPLPLAFLRGVGLPNNLIEYLPSLLGQPIQLYSCFISYSSKDDEFARRLHADLQNKGVRCWFAPENMKTRDRIDNTIDAAIRLRDKRLLVLSKISMISAWVAKEVHTALAQEQQHGRPVLFPIRVDDAVMDTTEQWAHDIRRTRHIGDFTRWKDPDAYQKALDRLLRDLRVEEG